MLLAELADCYVRDEHGRLRVAEATAYRYRVTGARLVEFFGDVDMVTVTAAGLIEWQRWLESRPGSGVVTVNGYKRDARAMWNEMRRRGLDVCATDGIWSFKKEPRGVRSIKPEFAWKLLAFSGIRDTVILLLVDDSARRRGGLANLQLCDLRIFQDDEDEWCVVGRTIEKGEKPQLLLAGEIPALALRVWLYIRENYLQALGVEDHGYVFINLRDGSPLSPHAFTQNVWRLRQKAQIPQDEPASLHKFRHKRAKELLKLLSLPEVRDILGHEEASTTADMYAVNGEDELIEAFFKRGRRREK